MRISDILHLRFCDIIKDGDRYRLNISEIKTGKERIFTVPEEIREFIAKKMNYLLSLNTKDSLVLGQLLGLRCVLEYIQTLEEDKQQENVKKR